MQLRITATTLAELRSQLLLTSPNEAGAFLLVQRSAGDLTLRSFDVFREEELDHMPGGIALNDGAKVTRLADAKRRGYAVIDVHTHPLSGRAVQFSRLDLQELPVFARYVRLKIPGLPFGALVFGRESYQGLAWNEATPEPLTLDVVGEALSLPPWLTGSDTAAIADQPMYDRQILAIGLDAQRRIGRLRMAVVGLGGTGSIVVQSLVHLGIRDFVLIDDDIVEWSNLSRLAGGTWADANDARLKATVASRLIRSVARTARVTCPGTLRSERALRLLQDVDLIVGAVDNDGARLIITELAASRIVPYLDIGVSVERDSQDSILLGGRSSFYIPGGPCLACADEIDFTEAAEDLEDEALGAIRRARGYGLDRRVEPALMPLTTAIVGQALIEFLAYISGMRPVECFFRYDASGQRLIRQNVLKQESCPVCAPSEGMGDRQQIERYTLPNSMKAVRQ